MFEVPPPPAPGPHASLAGDSPDTHADLTVDNFEGRSHGKATQGHRNAPTMRVDSQVIATLKRPQGHPNASLIQPGGERSIAGDEGRMA
jgi:hypothetical protein